ncbi:uncharacterized protein FOMMEDRAFT_155774 [Fomitiporia mediterranea MF3/22]|uniref:uncharacterized protein n=1 Tax=Fomitiporia mediterranea (strain MF3/22) TaxID=694068 RepID=UPI0004409A88|nr:uncharacterized protein FOMMEDRAFT_155774 [Fomitiporia mediterranea MF3/22]EJD04621.1 hypothetical protein FOMMEDRAFT_155774 [Fomitiporia mediterranea MF3/22]
MKQKNEAASSGDRRKSNDSKSQKVSRIEGLLHFHKQRELEKKLDQNRATCKSLYNEAEKKLNQLQSRTSDWYRSTYFTLLKARECLPSEDDLELIIETCNLITQHEKEGRAEDYVVPDRFPYGEYKTMGELRSFKIYLEEMLKDQLSSFNYTFVVENETAHSVCKKVPDEQCHQSALEDDRIKNLFKGTILFVKKEDWNGIKQSREALERAMNSLAKILNHPSYWKVVDTTVSELTEELRKIKSESSQFLEGRGQDSNTSMESLNKVMSELESLNAKIVRFTQREKESATLDGELKEFDNALKKPLLTWQERHPEASSENPKISKHPGSRRDSVKRCR